MNTNVARKDVGKFLEINENETLKKEKPGQSQGVSGGHKQNGSRALE